MTADQLGSFEVREGLPLMKPEAQFRWRVAAIVLAIPVLVGLVSYGVAWQWLRTGPVIDVERSVELGSLTAQAQIDVQITARNVGTQELYLSHFTTSCPLCIFVNQMTNSGQVAVQEVFLGPGEEVKLFVKLLVTSKFGESYQSKIWFQTNDPRQPEVEILFRGEVPGAFVCTPPEMFLGIVERGVSVNRIVQVWDMGRGGCPQISRAVVSGSDTLRAHVLEQISKHNNSTGETNERLVAEVKLTGTLPADNEGSQESKLELFEEGQERPLIVPIRYRVLPLIEVIPAGIVLPRVVNGVPEYTAKLSVRVRGEQNSR